MVVDKSNISKVHNIIKTLKFRILRKFLSKCDDPIFSGSGNIIQTSGIWFQDA